MSPTCILSLNLKNIIFFPRRKGRKTEVNQLVLDYLVDWFGGWVGGWGWEDIPHYLVYKPKQCQTLHKRNGDWRRLCQTQKCHVALGEAQIGNSLDSLNAPTPTTPFVLSHCLTQPQSTKTGPNKHNVPLSLSLSSSWVLTGFFFRCSLPSKLSLSFQWRPSCQELPLLPLQLLLVLPDFRNPFPFLSTRPGIISLSASEVQACPKEAFNLSKLLQLPLGTRTPTVFSNFVHFRNPACFDY